MGLTKFVLKRHYDPVSYLSDRIRFILRSFLQAGADSGDGYAHADCGHHICGSQPGGRQRTGNEADRG